MMKKMNVKLSPVSFIKYYETIEESQRSRLQSGKSSAGKTHSSSTKIAQSLRKLATLRILGHGQPMKVTDMHRKDSMSLQSSRFSLWRHGERSKPAFDQMEAVSRDFGRADSSHQAASFIKMTKPPRFGSVYRADTSSKILQVGRASSYKKDKF